jgi:hypothetical protein
MSNTNTVKCYICGDVKDKNQMVSQCSIFYCTKKPCLKKHAKRKAEESDKKNDEKRRMPSMSNFGQQCY